LIFFGLGNPGNRFLLTRHNFGFIFLDLFALNHHFNFKKTPDCSIAEGTVWNKKIMLCKPLRFMNNSGMIVKKIIEETFPKGSREDSFLVICDDLNLPLGRIKLYKRGTDGGHLGLRSIIETLDTISFLSLRLGTGPPPSSDWSDFVLAAFNEQELPTVCKMLDRAAEGLHLLLTKGFATSQTFLNTRTPQ